MVVGSNFTIAGHVFANSIAAWDGTNWQPLGSGMDGCVYALTIYNGELIAGGWFSYAGGVNANYIAHWSSLTWTPFGSGPFNGMNSYLQGSHPVSRAAHSRTWTLTTTGT